MDDVGVLIIAPSPQVCQQIQNHMREKGLQAQSCGVFKEALAAMETHFYPIVVLDCEISPGPIVHIIKSCREISPGSHMVVLSKTWGGEQAMELMQAGAFRLLKKPLGPPILLYQAIDDALANIRYWSQFLSQTSQSDQEGNEDLDPDLQDEEDSTHPHLASA